jgi:hypothetical protein
MTLSSKQITGVLAVLAVGVGGWYLARDAGPYLMAVALVGAIAVVFAGVGSGGPSLQGFVDAARRAGTGEKPSIRRTRRARSSAPTRPSRPSPSIAARTRASSRPSTSR